MHSFRIGIDLGGTKIEIVALGEDGVEYARARVETPRHYQATLEALAALISRVDEQLEGQGAAPRSASIGLGIPGTISPVTGLVKNANSTWLIGHPLDRDLEALVGRPVRVANDANCFALSEAVDGAGAGAETVFGVIVGTGVGGGLVIGGRVLDGPQRIGGEWGHNPLPWPTQDETPGPKCFCGLCGCMEMFVSGPGMERDYEAATGHRLTTHGIIEGAGRGDPLASASLDRYIDRMARGLSTVINVVDPDVVVLGGGMSNIPELAERVGRTLPAYVFTDECTTRVRKNVHGDSGGVRGAAWLWPVAESSPDRFGSPTA
jgi:fructokinase